MRKIISLVFLTLAAGLFAVPVSASNTEYCDTVVQGASKGLYGLCVAYYNATDSQGRDKIEALYNKRRGSDDPPLIPEDFNCPCFSTTDLVEAGFYHPVKNCNYSLNPDAGFELAFYNTDADPVTFRVEGPTGSGFSNSCFFQHALEHEDTDEVYGLGNTYMIPDDGAFSFGLSTDEIADCRAMIEGAIQVDFPNGLDDCTLTPEAP